MTIYNLRRNTALQLTITVAAEQIGLDSKFKSRLLARRAEGSLARHLL